MAHALISIRHINVSVMLFIMHVHVLFLFTGTILVTPTENRVSKHLYIISMSNGLHCSPCSCHPAGRWLHVQESNATPVADDHNDDLEFENDDDDKNEVEGRGSDDNEDDLAAARLRSKRSPWSGAPRNPRIQMPSFSTHSISQDHDSTHSYSTDSRRLDSNKLGQEVKETSVSI